MIIQGITLTNIGVNDGSFNSNGALLYIDIGNAASYSGSGTTYTDLSSNANNGTSAGSPVYSSAYSGYTNFNGAGNQYIATPTAKYNKTYTGKTVFIVARLTAITAGTFRCLFGTASGTRNFNTYIYSPSSGVYQIHYSTGGGGGFSNNLPLTTNQWFVVAVTHFTDGTVKYYFNGQPIGTNTGNTFSQWVSNGNENIGAGDNYWYGDISLCAVYGRALSANEIQQNYNAISNRYDLDIVTSGLLANYDMTTYVSGGTVADISGNGRTLTLYNTPTTTKVNNSTALVFNGTNQWAIDLAGYGSLLNTGSGWTYDIWARPTSVATGSLIVEYDNSTANSGFQDSQIAFVSNKINGGVWVASGGQTYITGPTYTAATWYHIVLTYNGTNTVTFYVNGLNQGTTTSVKGNPPTATYLSLAKNDTTGGYLGGSTNYFAGQIGAYKMYSRALSAIEVSNNFQALRNRFSI
jgi:hypothetical protein